VSSPIFYGGIILEAFEPSFIKIILELFMTYNCFRTSISKKSGIKLIEILLGLGKWIRRFKEDSFVFFDLIS